MRTAREQEINDRMLARCEYVLYLREQGLTYETIAKRLGVTKENVRQRLNRAQRERRSNARGLRHMVPTVLAVAELTKGLNHGNA